MRWWANHSVFLFFFWEAIFNVLRYGAFDMLCKRELGGADRIRLVLRGVCVWGGKVGGLEAGVDMWTFSPQARSTPGCVVSFSPPQCVVVSEWLEGLKCVCLCDCWRACAACNTSRWHVRCIPRIRSKARAHPIYIIIYIYIYIFLIFVEL